MFLHGSDVCVHIGFRYGMMFCYCWVGSFKILGCFLLAFPPVWQFWFSFLCIIWQWFKWWLDYKSAFQKMVTLFLKGRHLLHLLLLMGFQVAGLLADKIPCVITINTLTYLPLGPHICVGESGQHWFRKWLVAYSAPNHHLNQRWVIGNWAIRNKLQWNFNQNTKLFINENASENIVCEMAAILSGGDELNRMCITCTPIDWHQVCLEFSVLSVRWFSHDGRCANCKKWCRGFTRVWLIVA